MRQTRPEDEQEGRGLAVGNGALWGPGGGPRTRSRLGRPCPVPRAVAPRAGLKAGRRAIQSEETARHAFVERCASVFVFKEAVMRTPGKDTEWSGERSLRGAAEVRAGAGSRTPVRAALQSSPLHVPGGARGRNCQKNHLFWGKKNSY